MTVWSQITILTCSDCINIIPFKALKAKSQHWNQCKNLSLKELFQQRANRELWTRLHSASLFLFIYFTLAGIFHFTIWSQSSFCIMKSFQQHKSCFTINAKHLQQAPWISCNFSSAHYNSQNPSTHSSLCFPLN